MAQVTNITCDNCNAVLYGKDRAAFVKKENVQINGQIVVQKVDPKTGYSYPLFVTRTPNERMNFCDLVCLQEHVDYKEARYEEGKRKHLQEEASLAAIERTADKPAHVK
jgi:hypothetical protein